MTTTTEMTEAKKRKVAGDARRFGVRATAREAGVSESTLRGWVKQYPEPEPKPKSKSKPKSKTAGRPKAGLVPEPTPPEVVMARQTRGEPTEPETWEESELGFGDDPDAVVEVAVNGNGKVTVPVPVTLGVLTPTERSRREYLEAEVIVPGRATFAAVGTALLEIQSSRLYRDTHATFADYCREVCDLERTYAYTLMRMVKVADEVAALPAPPTTPAQIRALTKVPPDRRAAVWAEAVRRSDDGSPTAKLVCEVAGIGPKAKPARDDIEGQRAAGLIPEDAEVETSYVGGDPDSDEEPLASTEPTDEEFLESLPARAKLRDVFLENFDADALCYRGLTKIRQAYSRACKPVTNAFKAVRNGHIGPYMSRHLWYFRIKHPKDWIACPGCADRYGKPTGKNDAGGPCMACDGEGYRVAGF